MNVELGLKKIESLELDKKNLLVKPFDANELLNNVKTENMLLLDKVKIGRASCRERVCLAV